MYLLKKKPKYVLISSKILILTNMNPLEVGTIFFFYFSNVRLPTNEFIKKKKSHLYLRSKDLIS